MLVLTIYLLSVVVTLAVYYQMFKDRGLMTRGDAVAVGVIVFCPVLNTAMAVTLVGLIVVDLFKINWDKPLWKRKI